MTKKTVLHRKCISCCINKGYYVRPSPEANSTQFFTKQEIDFNRQRKMSLYI